jgi:hypothetical protein
MVGTCKATTTLRESNERVTSMYVGEQRAVRSRRRHCQALSAIGLGIRGRCAEGTDTENDEYCHPHNCARNP